MTHRGTQSRLPGPHHEDKPNPEIHREESVRAAKEFDEFYRGHVDIVVRYLRYGRGLDHDQARDATHDAFLEMLRRWPCWQDKPDDERLPYTLQIAANKANDLRGKDRAAVGGDALHRLHWADPTTSATSAASPETVALGRVRFEQLLAQLPSRQRAVLALASCGLSGRQIADTLAISLGTVHRTASDARANLRTLIHEEDSL